MSYDNTNESRENLLQGSTSSPGTEWKSRKQGTVWIVSALNIGLFLISLLLFVAGSHRTISEADLLRKTSFYSPVFDTIRLTTHTKTTVGALFEADNPSIYRDSSAPNPVVDKAWEDLERVRVFSITEDDARKLGKDPELAVRFPEGHSFGGNAIMASLDIFHQIHCLNTLRHLAWQVYDYNATVRRHAEPYWYHVSHCTDILLQNIMCTGTLDVITFNWVETQPDPFPDFNVNHQCRDYDAIVEWRDKHTVPAALDGMTRPQGAAEVPVSEDYYRLYGVDHQGHGGHDN